MLIIFVTHRNLLCEVTRVEIDTRIGKVLTLLEKHQDKEGGFAAFRMNPDSNDGNMWKPENKNTFLSANILLPVTMISHPKASAILNKEYVFLKKNMNRAGLIHYFCDRVVPYFIPYETDTNSLLGYISASVKSKSSAKELFYTCISDEGYFYLWFYAGSGSFFSRPFFNLSLLNDWNKAQKHMAFKNSVVKKDDAEFCVSANVLLYTGDNEKTHRVVVRLLEDIRSSEPIKLIYYPGEVIACYLFSRAGFYGKIRSFDGVRESVERRVETAYGREAGFAGKFLDILTANIFLFGNSINSFSQKIIDQCWGLYDDIETPFAFYCSNSEYDFNHSSKLHHAYFGGPALTVSFYLEFLNLLRFRKFGNLYGLDA
ncbi:MAG: hypothetical protein HYY40_12865 [Bacteroidetes bacterium]|nr:hypothetical protein [Bacteroidota bacterium]